MILLLSLTAVTYHYLGSVQDPTGSVVGLVANDQTNFNRWSAIKSNHTEFSIADKRSQYLGKEEHN